MHLLQNQQESMRLNLRWIDALEYQYKINHSHVYWWVRVVKDKCSSRAHEVTNRDGSLQTATRNKTRASA